MINKTLSQLLDMLHSEEQVIDAVVELGKLGDISAVQPLSELLQKQWPNNLLPILVPNVFQALANIGDESAFRALLSMEPKFSQYDYELYLSYLRKFGEYGIDILIDLVDKSLSNKWNRDNRLVPVLGRLGSPRAIPVLKKHAIYGAPLRLIDSSIVTALGNIDHPDAFSAFISYGTSDRSSSFLDTLTARGDIAIDALIERLKKYPDNKDTAIVLKILLARLGNTNAIAPLKDACLDGNMNAFEVLISVNDIALVDALLDLWRKRTRFDLPHQYKIALALFERGNLAGVDCLLQGGKHIDESDRRKAATLISTQIHGSPIARTLVEAITSFANIYRDSDRDRCFKWHSGWESVRVAIISNGNYTLPYLVELLETRIPEVGKEVEAIILAVYEKYTDDAILNFLISKSGAASNEQKKRLDNVIKSIYNRKVEIYKQHLLELPVAKESYPILITAFQSEDQQIRLSAISNLIRTQYPQVVPLLISALHDPSQEVRKLAIRSLGEMRDLRAISPLRVYLQSDDEICAEVVASLLTIEPSDSATLPIERLIKSDSRSVRSIVLQALAKTKHPSTIGYVLTIALEDKDQFLQKKALRAITESGSIAVECVIQKLGAIQNLETKITLIQLLGQLPPDQNAAEVVCAILKSPESDRVLRLAAFEAIQCIDSGALTSAYLVEILMENILDRRKITDALIRRGDKTVVGSLSNLIYHEDAELRMAVVEIIGSLGDMDMVDLLEITMYDPISSVRAKTAAVLGSQQCAKARELLRIALADTDSTVRACAQKSWDALNQVE